MALGLALAPLAAQGVVDTETQVAEAVARGAAAMQRGSPDGIWDEVKRIKALGGAALDAIDELYDRQEPVARLGLAAATAELGDLEQGIDRAFDLSTNRAASSETRVLAAQLIERYGPFVEDDEYLRRLSGRLLKVIEDPIGNPLPVLVIASQALYTLSGDPTGRDNLERYLKSDDVAVRNLAAIALSEIGNYNDEEVKAVLRSFQNEPGSRGRIARAYLDLDMMQRRLERAEVEPRRTRTTTDDRWKLLTEIEDKIKRYHIYGDTELAEHERLLERSAKGMVGSMDRHSTWYSPREYKKFSEDLDREYGGIGAYVGFRGEPPVFTILRPIYSGPAYAAGLRSRDVILDIDGWPTDGQNIDDIIDRLKGTPGTKVMLSVFRPGWEVERKFEIVRSKIEIASCQGVLLPGDIGYILLSTFSDDTSKELVRLLSAWHDAGTLNGIILDLRNNGGGYLETAREIADEFLPKDDLIVYSEGRNEDIAPRQELRAKKPENFPGIPMVVLINGSSASASEIVTGALKVHERATVIGMRSFGKGSVQRALRLDTSPEGRLRLTIARYYLPDGTSIHKEVDTDGAVIKGKEGGIDPNIVVDLDVITDIRDAEEIQRLEQEGKNRDYVDAHLDPDDPASLEHCDRLVLYGESRGDTYPGFAEFYAGLDTTATEQSVKRMLRYRMREVMQDIRKAEYLPLLPVDEDAQLQAALIHLYRKAGLDVGKIDGMKAYADAYDRLMEDQDALRRRFAR